MLQNAFAVGALTPSWWSFQHSPWWSGASLLHPQYPAHALRHQPRISDFRASGSALPACTHDTLGDRSFAVAGPRVWNSGPVYLRGEHIS